MRMLPGAAEQGPRQRADAATAARASLRSAAWRGRVDSGRAGMICWTRSSDHGPHDMDHPDGGQARDGAPQGTAPLLRIESLTKRFGPVVALDDVGFEVRPGEVVGLLGDNGAGKSTLIKIISGSLEPTSGRIWFDGARVTFARPADAKALGIETVYQDLSLCPNVDTVANFFMGRELHRNLLGFRFLRERAMQAETERALADIGTRIPSVRTTVEHLSGGQRQAIELCRFVHWGGRLVLLDEPFAALGVQQTRRGLELVEQIRRRGGAIVVITHNVLHVFQVADRIVVLRHGRITGERPVRSTSPEEIVSLITGELGDEAPAADSQRARR
jgi:D-xylose transport system ATP-binding protein